MSNTTPVPHPDYSYLENLNEPQKEAVTYNDGPSLVIAGAGSGKTRMLTYKIVHLIRLGYAPYRLMALTFTNKAAREMKDRIQNLVGEKLARQIKMGTFHSIFLRLLRDNCELLGYSPGFTIYDKADSQSLVKMIIQDKSLDEKTYKPSVVSAIISKAKNRLVSPEQFPYDKDLMREIKNGGRPLFPEIYKSYVERCKLSNAMDFDDILVNMNILLRDFPDLKKHYQDYFQYILIDEYQDTNFSQHAIITQLAGEKKKICAVGDDAQSIYSFRGANINNILNLENAIEGLRVFKLEQNYRSTQNIIDAAGSLISKNTRQIKKNIFSENEKGPKIEVVKNSSDFEEAFKVANMINNSKLVEHDTYDEYTILYRTNAQSRLLEEALRKRSIPYRVYGGLSFYQRKEVKDIIAYFRMSVNPDDDEALKRIINFPARGIGDTTMKKLIALATNNNSSIWKVLTTVNLKDNGFHSGTIKKLAGFVELIQEFIDDNENLSDAFELGQLIFNRTGILSLYSHDETPESISRKENLYEVLGSLKDFVEIRRQSTDLPFDMKSFLSEVMLMTDQDEKETEEGPKVTLMTVHAAKGVEFKHVYVVGLEENLFPSIQSKDSVDAIEEERRLLYVAITRAMKTCTLTFAENRYRNGTSSPALPSRFFWDFDPRLLNSKPFLLSAANSYRTFNREPARNYSSGSSFPKLSKNFKPLTNSGSSSQTPYNQENQSSVNNKIENIDKVAEILSRNGQLETHTADELNPGTRIQHSRFGKGEILKIDSLSGNETITVDFGVLGIKKLLLKFAKFTIIK